MYTLFLVGSLIFALAMLFIITSAFFGFLITRVPFVRTPSQDIEFIVKKLGITDRDVFYDLGSGDGKACLIVNELTGAKCVGFELTWWTYVWAKLKGRMQKSKVQFSARGARLSGRQGSAFGGKNHNIIFYRKNFFKHSWQEANYIYAYLYPPLMGRVKEKFLTECKPGAIAIIRDFPLPDLKPDKVYSMPKEHEIYVYRK